jgi:hypothetical protein
MTVNVAGVRSGCDLRRRRTRHPPGHAPATAATPAVIRGCRSSDIDAVVVFRARSVSAAGSGEPAECSRCRASACDVRWTGARGCLKSPTAVRPHCEELRTLPRPTALLVARSRCFGGRGPRPAFMLTRAWSRERIRDCPCPGAVACDGCVDAASVTASLADGQSVAGVDVTAIRPGLARTGVLASVPPALVAAVCPNRPACRDVVVGPRIVRRGERSLEA